MDEKIVERLTVKSFFSYIFHSIFSRSHKQLVLKVCH